MSSDYSWIKGKLEGLYDLEYKISTAFGEYSFMTGVGLAMCGYTITDKQMEKIRKKEELEMEINRLWDKVWDLIKYAVGNITHLNKDILKENMTKNQLSSDYICSTITSDEYRKAMQKPFKPSENLRGLTHRKYLELTSR